MPEKCRLPTTSVLRASDLPPAETDSAVPVMVKRVLAHARNRRASAMTARRRTLAKEIMAKRVNTLSNLIASAIRPARENLNRSRICIFLESRIAHSFPSSEAYTLLYVLSRLRAFRNV